MPMHDGATSTCQHSLSYFEIIVVFDRFSIQRWQRRLHHKKNGYVLYMAAAFGLIRLIAVCWHSRRFEIDFPSVHIKNGTLWLGLPKTSHFISLHVSLSFLMIPNWEKCLQLVLLLADIGTTPNLVAIQVVFSNNFNWFSMNNMLFI